jgi:diguanylate cyclase (GGDEF)-like protein
MYMRSSCLDPGFVCAPCVAAAAFLLLAAAAAAGVPEKSGTILSARGVQQLAPEVAALALAARVRGVVTYVDEEGGRLYVQDKTAGICVNLAFSESSQPLALHQLVEVTGVTGAGEFSPWITNAQIKVVGSGPLPEPAHPSFEQLTEGAMDGHWAEVSGIVRSGSVRQGRLLLDVKLAGGSVIAILGTYPGDWSRTLIDSRVFVTGAIAQLHNYRHQAVGVSIMVPPGFVRIEEPAPARPFSLPLSTINTVGSYPDESDTRHRVHVRGEVIGVEPDKKLYIASRDGNLEVDARPACVAAAGDVIDVVGFPGMVISRPALLNSSCRKVAGSGGIVPIRVKAEQILPPDRDIDAADEGLEQGTLYDMALIRIGGVLLQSSRGPSGVMLLLDSEGKQFIARLPFPDRKADVHLEKGARLEVTGVCVVAFDQYHHAESFRILLRTAADIAVIQPAPWLNLDNAIRALAIVSAILFAAIFWVARQSLQLHRVNSSLRRLSFQDALTGIANRRKFDLTLASALRRASKAAAPVSLLMVDVDYFKALNDCYGHQRGDECLIQVAGALKSVPLRKTDLVARYGGEEFGIILPGTDLDGALATAERIRVAVADLAITHEVSPFNHVSVSAGVATMWPDRTASCATLISLADGALYHSKVSGRNRVSCGDCRVPGAISHQPVRNGAHAR